MRNSALLVLGLLLASCSAGDTQPEQSGSPADISATVDRLMEENGLSGVAWVKLDGEVVHERAYGMANAELELENTPDTIFGIGSRPIDFTVAAIYLLAERGELSIDDRLDKYYPDAPDDRAGITIRQMMSGESGLPDFPANESDWDPDLAWIDRAEFERRTMEIPLIFVPGEGNEHSHWAFGVLAAIVERVSGESYEAFLRTNFLDPAGMTRTGSYGELRDLSVSDFAAGSGVQRGLPNIPPNWGPTSWLVKGSGGMYSSLGDLQKFYTFVTGEDGLTGPGRDHFLSPSAQLDGSDRGFELFSFADEERTDETYVFINDGAGEGAVRAIVDAIVPLMQEN